MHECYVADEQAMMALGTRLAQILTAGCQVHLYGELGAGKTTLVRALLRAMGYSAAVKSPTYTLIEPYEVNGQPIYHFDLYRLADPEELEFLGYRDCLDTRSLCLVEWPERAAEYLQAADILIEIKHLPEGRQVRIGTETGLGQTLLANWKSTEETGI